MKKLFLFGFFCIALFPIQAQKLNDSEVPESVKSAFKKQFPTAKVENWEKEGDNYEAEFKFNKTETNALFSNGGKFLRTEVDIPASELPPAIGTYIAAELGGIAPKEASRITDNKGQVTYEAEIDGADYFFDSNGAFIKKDATKLKDERPH